ncbi:ferredoxin [Mycolicibacter sinensis]|uniref:ferredoxin n=1 Tax=Mycolicibacter sinensis (strain JDM601) TaxID=875328 RepID=UPI00059DF010|nr:ferredoxin [Mycolicibacter sinensis]
MKVSVNGGRCEGHGMCEATAPDFFTLDEDGYSSIGSDKVVPPGRERAVRLGVESCPVAALTVTES